MILSKHGVKIIISAVLVTLTTTPMAKKIEVDCSASTTPYPDGRVFVAVMAAPSLVLIKKEFTVPTTVNLKMIPIIAKFNEGGKTLGGLFGRDEWSITGNVMATVEGGQFDQVSGLPVGGMWVSSTDTDKTDVNDVTCYLIK
jgi:hypothetical protein